ncbi:hypothetical protein [Parabacteroides massiliensis]|jgi:hypothetical protein|uniref:hypothetical protein n=1 Tax=Parabacteroides massiliensis TaxID=1750560 RepID=UPI00096A3A6A|nr:hypothetical protein [Parabacteroides massiliensis]
MSTVALRKLPIGIQSFEKLRMEGKLNEQLLYWEKRYGVEPVETSSSILSVRRSEIWEAGL